MKSAKAIVTLAIGKHYRDRWYKLCSVNWRRYADLHGYDIVCIDNPLDSSPRAQLRSAAWQKCLILGDERVQKYDQVVWLDSDIFINPSSPCVVYGVPENKIGAVDMFVGPLSESLPGENHLLVNRASHFWQWSFSTAKEFYLKGGLPDLFNRVVQSGVMVLSPRYHRPILEHTYYNYEDTPSGHFEMESLSYEIVKSNCVHWLDYRFNRLWIECALRDYPFLLSRQTAENRVIRTCKRLTRVTFQSSLRRITTSCLTTAFINNYFLHFAGTAHYMPLVNTNISSWNELQGKICF